MCVCVCVLASVCVTGLVCVCVCVCNGSGALYHMKDDLVCGVGGGGVRGHLGRCTMWRTLRTIDITPEDLIEDSGCRPRF